MAKISARGATAVAQVKRTHTLHDGTVVISHRALCSDGRILERSSYSTPDGWKHSSGYVLKGKTPAVRDAWVVAQVVNGWERE